jgi:predicted dehydrogenase
VSLRIGVIGAGTMGALHARVIAGRPDVKLAWIADPDPANRAVADRFGATALSEPDLGNADAVVIAAPTQFHHGLALSVIDAGMPLLLEKPLADTYAHSEQIVRAARDAGIVMTCGLLERFNPVVRTAAEIAREPLHVATVRHSPYTQRIVTGAGSDLLIHDVDMALRLFGEQPVAVTGHHGHFEPRSRSGSEDVVDCTLRFAGGQIASLSVSRIAQRKVRMLTIAEIGRTIEADLLRQAITIYRHVEGAMYDEDAGYHQQTIIEIPVVKYPGEPLQHQLQHFVDLVEGRADAAAELDSLLAPHAVIDHVEAAARA